MKTLAVSIVLALGLSAPAFAQTPAQPPVEATPAPAPEAIDATDPGSSEILTEATTPEARKMQLLKCSGPPPRPKPALEALKQPPATEQPASGG